MGDGDGAERMAYNYLHINVLLKMLVSHIKTSILSKLLIDSYLRARMHMPQNQV